MTPLPTYGLLAVSLGGIFAAGGAVGYYLGKGTPPPAAATIASIENSPGASPEQWAGLAFDRLAAELKLSDSQRLKVRPYLASTAERVFLERDRALLQMHLRLLEVHNLLLREPLLDDVQKKQLSASRAKLKAFILSGFSAILRNDEGAVPDL